MEGFITGYHDILKSIANISIYTLELVGIAVVIIGAIRAVVQAVRAANHKTSQNLVITLGKHLALALEFKMGAEIIKTVIIENISELLVLAFVIVLRAALAFLIHWEIKAEKKDLSEQMEFMKTASEGLMNHGITISTPEKKDGADTGDADRSEDLAKPE